MTDAINPVAALTDRRVDAPPASAGSLDYNAFLQLLIAQLENQDPLKPMESTEYVAQLATFSQVEQTIKTNENLDSLLVQTRVSQAEALVGQTITSQDGTVSGEIRSVHIHSDGSVAVLTDGRELPLGAGVTLGERP